MSNDSFQTIQPFDLESGRKGLLHSLPALATRYPNIHRMPWSLRIVLESVLRHCDGERITEAHVEQLANWSPRGRRTLEIPFVVARVILQDFTGIPLLADLAAMRSTAQASGQNPKRIEPLVPVDLVVDHSVMIDHYRGADALDLNMKLEFQRNRERYQFMKWGMQAFETFQVVPPGVGIVHQVNLEHLAPGIHTGKWKSKNLYYPDTLVGTDSHTTMVNGIGAVGWGVGGIEAEAAMLGQPMYILTPDVVGVRLLGTLRAGVTATDLVLALTELLRGRKVVGKFVEFCGPGLAELSLPDRATIANMAPEYGATMGWFPVDDRTAAYLEGTGRPAAEVDLFRSWFRAQEMYGAPDTRQVRYTELIEFDLRSVVPSVAGPRRPQDRIEIGQVSRRFDELLPAPATGGGFGRPLDELTRSATTPEGLTLRHGDVLIAAITSCTNTSNPGVMLAAGLLARKAVARGLTVAPHIKTSLAPGSRVVTDYLHKTGLLTDLEKLGFSVAAYGCTTCIGNAGDLTPSINAAITGEDLICAAVLSGNRNFEARIHPNLRANFLASPPLVVAYAIAGSVRTDLMTQPLGQDPTGKDVFLGDIWPSPDEIAALMEHAMNPATYRKLYRNLTRDHALWNAVTSSEGEVYDWPDSTYIARPPFLDGFTPALAEVEAGHGTIRSARIMALFGDSITTDHISPAGSIRPDSPAGQWLQERGVLPADFNSYGARRGHHEVMVRGTFANVRIRNLMIPARPDGTREEGGYTLFQDGAGGAGERTTIHDAALRYQAAGIPTVVFAGEEYGTGSSRDWAAKGTRLLGIRAVVARSFERIHRSNLVGMGVLPLQFRRDESWETLGLTGREILDILVPDTLTPQQDITLVVQRPDGTRHEVSLLARIDTPIEVEYYRHGGILPYVLRQILRD